MKKVPNFPRPNFDFEALAEKYNALPVGDVLQVDTKEVSQPNLLGALRRRGLTASRDFQTSLADGTCFVRKLSDKQLG